MKLFSDSLLKTEVSTLDFGIVEAGESKTVSYYLLNDTGTEVIDLEYKVSNKEITILSSPRELAKDKSGEIKLLWKSNLNVKAGLKATLDIKGSEIWRYLL